MWGILLLQTSCGSCLKHSSKRGEMLQEDNSSQVITQPKNIVDADQTPAGQGFSHRSQKKPLIRQVRNSGNGTHESNETSQALVYILKQVLSPGSICFWLSSCGFCGMTRP